MDFGAGLLVGYILGVLTLAFVALREMNRRKQAEKILKAMKGALLKVQRWNNEGK